MATLSNISRKIFLNNIVLKNMRISHRFVSTSTKKEDSSNKCEPAEDMYRKIPDFTKPLQNKNWVSFGFDEYDQDLDKFKMHFTICVLFSFFLCGTAFIYAYFPDRNRNDWARREAFIRLHEREQLGLEPIDINYIDPSKIILPPDEELQEEDIVI